MILSEEASVLTDELNLSTIISRTSVLSNHCNVSAKFEYMVSSAPINLINTCFTVNLMNCINQMHSPNYMENGSVTAYLHYRGDTNEVNKLDNNIWMLLQKVKRGEGKGKHKLECAQMTVYSMYRTLHDC